MNLGAEKAEEGTIVSDHGLQKSGSQASTRALQASTVRRPASFAAVKRKQTSGWEPHPLASQPHEAGRRANAASPILFMRHGTAMHAARAASRGEARACFEPPGSSNRRLLSRELAGPFIYSSPWPPRQAAIWRREQRQGKPGKARRGLGGIGSGGPCTVLYIWSNSFPSDLPGPAEVTNRASASKPCFLQVRVPLIDLPNLVELPRGGLGGIPMQL